MEQVPSLRLTQKIQEQLSHSRVAKDQTSFINSHCKRDHLTPTPFDQRKNISTYVHSHSPSKNQYNSFKPEAERELQRFRKYQSSTTGLPNLPSISENSHYNNNFNGHSLQKLQKGKQQESWFLKSNWALDPKSSYQKNYCGKDGIAFNKENKQRPDHNHLTVFELREGQKKGTNYKTQFQPYVIKKQAQIVIGNKDHLHSKENFKNDLAISEYQRRYDSVMEVAKPKESVLSLYKKDTAISRQPKIKL